MLPVIPKPSISPAQKKAAIAVAGTIDVLQVIVAPALGLGYLLDNVLDVIAAIALTAICGFKWQFLVVFFLELVPMMDWLPTWTAVALTLSTSASPGPSDGRVNVTPAPPVQANTADHGPIEVSAIAVPPVQNEVKGQ